MKRRVLITAKRTGLGSDLVSVIGAWFYARSTGRSLAIDWRRSRYLHDESVNLFFEIFDVPQSIGGVDILSAQDLIEVSPHIDFNLSELSEKDYLCCLFQGRDVPGTVISCERTMHVLPSVEIQRSFLAGIQLKAPFQAMLATVEQQCFTKEPVIAIHLRHGNGEVLGFGRDDLVCRSVSEIAKTVKAILAIIDPRGARKVFISTDSVDLQNELIRTIPASFCIQKQLPPPGSGPLHIHEFGMAGAISAVIDMVLLAKSEVLIYNNSWFSHYARVIGNFVLQPININPACDYGSNEYYLRIIMAQ